MSDHGLCCVECYANGVAQGENTGAAVELERIIALPFIHEAFGGKHNEDCITCHNIALIKGENE